MSALPPPGTVLFDHAVAARSLAGDAASGDLFLVRPYGDGILIAAIDGLGHGSEAAEAAAAAASALRAELDLPLPRLIERCHAALMLTRGAAMTLAALDGRLQTMSWIAIGNVEGLLLRRHEDGARETLYVLPRGGIVGHALPTLHETTTTLCPGDLVLFATDGIAAGFEASVDSGAALQSIADHVLDRYGRSTDDALVLAGRWHGTAGASP